MPFLDRGVRNEEVVLCISSEEKIESVRAELPAYARDSVEFAPSVDWYLGPQQALARAYYLVDEHAQEGRSVRILGEPFPGVTESRDSEHLGDVRGWLRYEALLNVALASHPVWIVCPYEQVASDRGLLDEAHVCHPQITSPTMAWPNETYEPPEKLCQSWGAPLSPEPAHVDHVEVVKAGNLSDTRRIVAAHARRLGLGESATERLVYAVNEVATNAVEHAGGTGTVRMWTEGSRLVCEVSDRGGGISDPLPGLLPPSCRSEGGRGLWLTRELCTDLGIRTGPDGTTVRLRTELGT